MPETVLAIFGAWMLVNLMVGALFAAMRSRLENRRMRTPSHGVPVQSTSPPPGGVVRH